MPQRQRVADVHHHREADDLARRLEVTENTGVQYRAELPAEVQNAGNPNFL